MSFFYEPPLPREIALNELWSWEHSTRYLIQDNLIVPDPKAKIIKFRPFDSDKPQKKNPTMFKHFVTQPRTVDTMLNFAGEFGPLRFEENDIRLMMNEHWLMTLVVNFWDALNGKLSSEIKFGFKQSLVGDQLHLFLWENDADFETLDNPSPVNNKTDRKGNYATIRYSMTEPHIPRALHLSGKITPSHSTTPESYYYWALQAIVNSQLTAYPTCLHLYLEDSKKRYRQKLAPTSLIAYMWYEFYRMITGERMIKQCEICGRYSDVTERNNRLTWVHHPECLDAIKRRRQRGQDITIPIGKPGRPRKNKQEAKS